METQTPIENRAAWRIHRAAARTVRNNGGHFFCSQAIGFQVASPDGEQLAKELGRPCDKCAGIWKQHQAKEQRP